MKNQLRQANKTRKISQKRVRFARSVRGGYVMKKKSATKSKRSHSGNKKSLTSSNLDKQQTPRGSTKSKRPSFLRKSVNNVQTEDR